MTPSQQANPNPTNSEMDSKTIIKHPRLNDGQRDELIEQFVELQVDSMELQDLIQFVTETLKDDYTKLSDSELEDEIRYSFDEETLNDLVDNVQDVTVLDTNNTGGKY
tara:strand:+ start:130 stop:453 length:324 start_codon:yes stop_codon:yes gene_type:complete